MTSAHNCNLGQLQSISCSSSRARLAAVAGGSSVKIVHIASTHRAYKFIDAPLQYSKSSTQVVTVTDIKFHATEVGTDGFDYLPCITHIN
jgi:hypothetical protein